MNLKDNSIRIGLLWHSASSGNLGVGALTLANMAIARKVAEGRGLKPRFTIIGMRDGGSSYVGEHEADSLIVDSRSLLKPSGCWKLFGELDCILDIGAGDSFADIYGFKRFMFLWLTKMIAIVRGTPLLLSPQTIGPFTRSPYVQLGKIAMERATAVVARDQKSLDILHEIAPKAHALLSVDVAFVLPFEDRSAERHGATRRIGINVSGLLYNEAESGQNHFGLDVDYAQLMRRFIADLLKDPANEVHLVAHATSKDMPWDDDGLIADRLAAEFPGTIRVPDFVGPSEAKSYISSLDFLVAGRMHACIGAFSAGTPVVPVAYSRKFSGLFGMLEYPWMVPVNGIDTDGALAYMHDCFARRDELARDEQAGMLKVNGLLDNYRDALTRLFVSAIDKPAR